MQVVTLDSAGRLGTVAAFQGTTLTPQVGVPVAISPAAFPEVLPLTGGASGSTYAYLALDGGTA